jgi:hypothetical protein
MSFGGLAVNVGSAAGNGAVRSEPHATLNDGADIDADTPDLTALSPLIATTVMNDSVSLSAYVSPRELEMENCQP